MEIGGNDNPGHLLTFSPEISEKQIHSSKSPHVAADVVSITKLVPEKLSKPQTVGNHVFDVHAIDIPLTADASDGIDVWYSGESGDDVEFLGREVYNEL